MPKNFPQAMLDQRGAGNLQLLRKSIGEGQQRFFNGDRNRLSATTSTRPPRLFLDPLPLTAGVLVEFANSVRDALASQLSRRLRKLVRVHLQNRFLASHDRLLLR